LKSGRKCGPSFTTGQYFDDESGLHYNRHRYFDPGTGIFISQDPIGLEGGLNSYEFAPNMFGWIDPLGLKKKCSHRKPQKKTKSTGRTKARNRNERFVMSHVMAHPEKGFDHQSGGYWRPMLLGERMGEIRTENKRRNRSLYGESEW
jgi:RHS repeat-associated protein